MRLFKETVAALVIAPALVLAAAGCSADNDAAGSSGTDPAAPEVLDLKLGTDPAVAAKLPDKYKNGIRVAIDVPNPPFEMFDSNQRIIGFDPDLATALGQKLGVRVTVNQVPWESLLPSLQSGQQDIIVTGMNDTVERQANLDFVDYVQGGFSILVAEGNPEGIKTIHDLCGRNVAVQKSTVQGEILRDMAAECQARGSEPVVVSELPAEEDARTAVRAGKAVADVFDSAQAKYVAENAGGGKHFDLIVDPEHPNGYFPVYSGIAVLKSNPQLTAALQAALQSLIDDGSYTKLLDHHGLSAYGLKEATLNAGK
ncbi:ABC-type amino acid transport substrate-binding protein [Mycobacterium frederiksbergense]|uniref:ABC-type amino acid transport substrate-binding protein n=1 Tax=Mycolicibacterium frederiksbergense TaxID=117567 RepID=A0ABT6L4B9_9MYCO|nr:ABC transporter substrate-binding protein [Mycolicibacterium frederiksbergense]MDH6197769.1 ABC-type amino acid transport substrate-binding protein [Mycolicibacterium frederiksbergense]